MAKMDETTFNITLDRAGDWSLPVSRFDDQGIEIDLSGADLTFVVKGKFALLADADPANPKGRVFNFTKEHAQQVGETPRAYMVLIPSDDDVLWRATINAEGFAQ